MQCGNTVKTHTLMKTRYSIEITPSAVTLCGERLHTQATGSALLTELYRRYVGDYPKFFKMDTLARLGFIASELLLLREGDRFRPREDRAIVFANRNASLKDDTDYWETVRNAADCYPSPALFVYTLPNIVTGEIAIRNRWYGETSFYVLDSEQQLDRLLQTTFSPHTASILGGWLECTAEDNYIAKLKIVENG